MRRERAVALAVVAAATLALATPTGSVSSVAADRGVRAAVADDSAAYLGFAQTTATANGTTNLTVTVTNRLPSGVALTSVELAVDGESATLVDDDLDPGESVSATVPSVDCGDPIAVEASGDGTRIHLDRAVDCG